MIGCAHANVWKFLGTVQKEQSMCEVVIEQYCAGIFPKRKRSSLAQDERISNLVAKYDPAEVIEYLRGMAYNINK